MINRQATRSKGARNANRNSDRFTGHFYAWLARCSCCTGHAPQRLALSGPWIAHRLRAAVGQQGRELSVKGHRVFSEDTLENHWDIPSQKNRDRTAQIPAPEVIRPFKWKRICFFFSSKNGEEAERGTFLTAGKLIFLDFPRNGALPGAILDIFLFLRSRICSGNNPDAQSDKVDFLSPVRS